MILAVALLLCLTLCVLTLCIFIPIYCSAQVRTGLPLGGERELFLVTALLLLGGGVWLLVGDTNSLLDRTAVSQLEMYHRIQQDPASCQALLWRSPALVMQALPLCAGGRDLSSPFIMTVVSWSALIVALFAAASVVSGPLAGVTAALLVFSDNLARDPFRELGPESLCLAVSAVLFAAVIVARSLRQELLCLLLAGAAILLCTSQPPAASQPIVARDLLPRVLPFLCAGLGGLCLLRFFTRGLRRRFVETDRCRRLLFVGFVVAAVVGGHLYRGTGEIPLSIYISLLFVIAAVFGAALGGCLRFLAIHPVAAPLLALLGVLIALSATPSIRPRSPGVVALATDISAVAPTGSIVATSLAPGLLREFLIGREVVSYAQLTERIQADASPPCFIEARFVALEELSILRQSLHLDPVLPGIYRATPLNASGR